MPSTDSAPDLPGLTKRLVENSAEIHKKSNALLLAKVATLFTDQQLYGKAIGCFYPVLVELEAALRKAMDADKRVGAVRESLTPLWRVPGYEADLQYYLGEGWRQQISISPAIEAYVAWLREIAAEQPLLLLAHAFTHHAAGLSGGRIMKRMARKYMHLPEDEGTAIFDFPGGVELKEAFKHQLDAVGAALHEEEVQAILDEQVRAFEYINAIMQEFRIGLLPQLRAPLRLLPPRYLAATAALVLAVVVVLVVAGRAR